MQADVLVCACGQLTRPAVPDLPGLDRFAGPAFHSSQWRHDVDLRGLRVGAMGSGASAIQFVPAIQPLVKSLTVLQRTPPWILPKPDRAYRAFDTKLFERVPVAQLAGRFGFWAFLEAGIAGFIGHDHAMRPLAAISRAHLRRQVRDPELRRKLTPTYRMGCKRVLLSSDWYPALTQPNVEVVTGGVKEVTETGIVLGDGRAVELDVLIFGTGFRTREFVAPMRISGRGPRTLEEVWNGVPHAWHGLSVPEFPNMFLIYGPNTFGGSGSAIYMIESQIRHVGRGGDRVAPQRRARHRGARGRARGIHGGAARTPAAHRVGHRRLLQLVRRRAGPRPDQLARLHARVPAPRRADLARRVRARPLARARGRGLGPSGESRRSPSAAARTRRPAGPRRPPAAS